MSNKLDRRYPSPQDEGSSEQAKELRSGCLGAAIYGTAGAVLDGLALYLTAKGIHLPAIGIALASTPFWVGALGGVSMIVDNLARKNERKK